MLRVSPLANKIHVALKRSTTFRYLELIDLLADYDASLPPLHSHPLR